MKTQTVKGFSDYTGEEAIKRAEVRKIIENTFKKYGFEPAETPVIEYEEFVKGNNEQDEAVSDIFRLKDKGDRDLALRYEFTFQLKRISKQQKLPYKRYQIGYVFRDEPIKANRFRQFTQCDADIIGSTKKDEAEVLAIISEVMEKLNIKPTIYINNRKLLNEILEDEGIKEEYQQDIIKEIDKLDKQSKKQIADNLKKYNAEKLIDIFSQPEDYFSKYTFYKEIQELKSLCKNYNLEIKFQPSLARGLSYYNSTIFEIKSSEMKETVSGGGSYLVNEVQSTGFAFGLDRLFSLADIKISNKPILILSINQDKESINLTQKIRKQNIPAILLTDKSPSKALDYANSKNLKYIIFIGKKESEAEEYTIKDLESGEEKTLSEKDLIKFLK